MKRFLAIIAVLVLCFTTLPLTVFASDYGSNVMDYADVLDDSQEETLEREIRTIRDRYDFDVVIVTVDSIGSATEWDYADDYYDDNGYGCGVNRDGCLMLVYFGPDGGGAYLSTCGYGITAITDKGIDLIMDDAFPKMVDGNFYEAFRMYNSDVDYLLEMAKTGTPYDDYGDSTYGDNSWNYEPVEHTRSLGGSQLGIGGFFGAIVAWINNKRHKGQLRSVSSKYTASDYFKRDSLAITEQYDRMAGHHVNRMPIPRNTSSGPRTGSMGGGSHTHVSHSGTTHGGGGRRF